MFHVEFLPVLLFWGNSAPFHGFAVLKYAAAGHWTVGCEGADKAQFQGWPDSLAGKIAAEKFRLGFFGCKGTDQEAYKRPKQGR